MYDPKSQYHLWRLVRYGCAPLYIYAQRIEQIPLMIGESMFDKFDMVMRVTSPYNQFRPTDGQFYYQGYEEILKNVK